MIDRQSRSVAHHPASQSEPQSSRSPESAGSDGGDDLFLLLFLFSLLLFSFSRIAITDYYEVRDSREYTIMYSPAIRSSHTFASPFA
jgi:hypothetical protein